jgi:hypothetical protein
LRNMLVELKRCNNLGSIDGLLFLAKILFDKPYVNKQEIANRAALENSITLNCGGAVAFYEYLGYLNVEFDRVIPTDKLNSMRGLDNEAFIKSVIKDCISALSEDGIFDSGSTCFDVEEGQLSIKRSAFPLAYAAIRNFLTVVGALDKEENGEIGIAESYESDFSDLLRSRKEKFSLEQLLERQKAQNERGLAAEEFVLRIEKDRLPQKSSRIKRISDFDVSAGFDIVSFADSSSGKYDRFIEVKCYIGEPHFYWSQNEADVAQIKGNMYYLCLVDYNKMINEPGYLPEYIQNPYAVIFEDDNWLVNTASYKVQKI